MPGKGKDNKEADHLLSFFFTGFCKGKGGRRVHGDEGALFSGLFLLVARARDERKDEPFAESQGEEGRRVLGRPKERKGK